MQTSHKQLFGGALIGAGIAVSAAMTTTANADFIAAATPAGYAGSYSTVYGSGTTEYVFDTYSTSDAVFVPSYSYSGNGLDMSAYAGANLMGASLTLTDAAAWNYFTAARTYQWFTVESGREITLEWDFTNADNGRAVVLQAGVGFIYFETDLTAGSVTLNLTPGNTYVFVGEVGQVGTNGGGFVRLTNVIPAPGAMALLAGGLIGVRGRRRRS